MIHVSKYFTVTPYVAVVILDQPTHVLVLIPPAIVALLCVSMKNTKIAWYVVLQVC